MLVPLPTPLFVASISLYIAALEASYVSVLHGIDQRLILLAGIMLGGYGRAWIAYSRDLQEKQDSSLNQRLSQAFSEWVAAIAFSLPLSPMVTRWAITVSHKWDVPAEALTPSEVLLTVSAALAFCSAALTGLAFRWISKPIWPKK